LLAFKSDPDVVRYTDEDPHTPETAREWLQGAIHHNRLADRIAYNLAICLRDTDEIIGWIGIGPSDRRRPREQSLGYQLNRSHWGKGYATEALRAVLGFAFRELGAHRVFSHCEPANVASARVMEKAGMRRGAHFRERDWTTSARAGGPMDQRATARSR
jgi:RimJ/RimL family protein N-acetyltransferase